MLKPEEVEITLGRAEGGDFMLIEHKPTGVRLGMGPPLPSPMKARLELLQQMETELRQRGLTQYILADKRLK